MSGTSLNWEGIPVLPNGYDSYGNDILPGHAQMVNPDLILTVMDAWVLAPQALQRWKTACWAPVDCEPLGVMDENYFRQSGSIPIAVSRFGERQFREAGFTPLYVPHAIDTSVFTPPDSKERVREELKIPQDAFVVGINAANKDAVRKSFPQQFRAFAKFRKQHPEAMLFVHTMIQAPQALNLMDIATKAGIRDAIRFTDQYGYVTGRIQPANLAAWYGAIDVLSAAAHAEGFGLPIIEAQACGTPVITTNFSSMPELTHAGWTVEGEDFWNGAHQAWWRTPDVDEITEAYEKAYAAKDDEELRKQGREFALQYDAGRVLTEYWIPVLKEIADS